MSSGSTGSKAGGFVKKQPMTDAEKQEEAEKKLADRELRNIRAKTNMLLQEEMKRKRKEAEDGFDEPGEAFKLLKRKAEAAYCEKGAAKKEPEKEYGEWGTEHWNPLTQAPYEDEKEEDMEAVEEELAEPACDAGDDQDLEQEDEQQEEEPAEAAVEEDEQGEAETPEGEGLEAAASGKGGGKWGKKGGKKGGRKGSKPWWAQTGWKSQSKGKKGQGKGQYDSYGGEYCVGGYRAVNGEFFPHLGFQLICG